jgi:hypothetical protein
VGQRIHFEDLKMREIHRHRDFSNWKSVEVPQRISNVNEVTNRATREVDEVVDDPKYPFLKAGLCLVGTALFLWVLVVLLLV